MQSFEALRILRPAHVLVLCGAIAGCGLITRASDYHVLTPASGSSLHFLQEGRTVTVVLRVAGAEEEVTLRANGPFAFSHAYTAGDRFEAHTRESECWVGTQSGTIAADGDPHLEVRCRIIRQVKSEPPPQDPTEARQAYSTASTEFEDVPRMEPLRFTTDLPSSVLVNLTLPANAFLRTDDIVPSGVGELAIDVDGTVAAHTEHVPMREGQASPNALVGTFFLPPGAHTIRLRRRVSELTSASRYLMGDAIDGVVMQKVLSAVVLESLASFRSLQVSAIGPQGDSQPLGRVPGLGTSTESDLLVLSGIHVPRFSVFSAADKRTQGRLALRSGEDEVLSSEVWAPDRLERSATLVWLKQYPPAPSVVQSVTWSKASTLQLPSGATLFAATFKDLATAPSPPAQVLVGTQSVADGVTQVPLHLSWRAPTTTQVWFACSLSRISSDVDGGSGFVSLRANETLAAKVFFQSQSRSVGHGLFVSAFVNAQPGDVSFSLEVTSRHGAVHLGDDASSRSACMVLPLR